jgi:uncharacterized protein YqcC (DUF446 family)
MMDQRLFESAGQAIAAIEAELQRLGRWSDEAPTPEQLTNMGPFGMHTMAFEQWLQWVLVPRVHETISNHGTFPPSSQVSVFAVREYDGDPDAAHLVDLLQDFDALFTKGERESP